MLELLEFFAINWYLTKYDDDTAKAKGSNHNSLLIQYLYTEIANSNDNPISGCIEITCKNRFQEF